MPCPDTVASTTITTTGRGREGRVTVETTTAETFSVDIVRLIRSHHIHTLELHSATERTDDGPAAFRYSSSSSSSSFPAVIVVEARLTSALAWQSDSRNGHHCEEDSFSSPFSKNGDNIFTYHISFLQPKDGEVVGSLPSLSSKSPQTTLSAKWCAQLQRRLAICSAVTGFPTRFCVSLLPYVPNLTWDRGRDGLLGATHSAVMMSRFPEKSTLEDTSGGTAVVEHLVQVSLLVNANIPLGQEGGRNTAVLLLHAADGDSCSAASSPLLVSPHECRKRSRHSGSKSERLKVEKLLKKGPLFLLMSRYSERHIIPKISWEAIWSHPMQTVKDGHNDVCGLQEQLGCSFYLEGALDARSVQSITIIVDAPIELWCRVLYSDAFIESSGDNDLLQRFPDCIAKTAMGALSRLAAENIDCFMRRAVFTQKKKGGEEKDEEGTANTSAGGKPKSGSIQQSWSLLAQSIADSLAQILRTSQNRVFVAEVHRLLMMHQGNTRSPIPWADAGDSAAAPSDLSAESLAPSLATTVSLLQWSVETRLMER